MNEMKQVVITNLYPLKFSYGKIQFIRTLLKMNHLNLFLNNEYHFNYENVVKFNSNADSKLEQLIFTLFKHNNIIPINSHYHLFQKNKTLKKFHRKLLNIFVDDSYIKDETDWYDFLKTESSDNMIYPFIDEFQFNKSNKLINHIVGDNYCQLYRSHLQFSQKTPYSPFVLHWVYDEESIEFYSEAAIDECIKQSHIINQLNIKVASELNYCQYVKITPHKEYDETECQYNLKLVFESVDFNGQPVKLLLPMWNQFVHSIIRMIGKQCLKHFLLNKIKESEVCNKYYLFQSLVHIQLYSSYNLLMLMQTKPIEPKLFNLNTLFSWDLYHQSEESIGFINYKISSLIDIQKEEITVYQFNKNKELTKVEIPSVGVLFQQYINIYYDNIHRFYYGNTESTEYKQAIMDFIVYCISVVFMLQSNSKYDLYSQGKKLKNNNHYQLIHFVLSILAKIGISSTSNYNLNSIDDAIMI